MAWVATLPCSVLNLHCKGRTTVHHCQGLAYRGMGQKASDFDTIPLCEAHHLFGKYSIEQMGIRAWERCELHGTQAEYLEETKKKWALRNHSNEL